MDEKSALQEENARLKAELQSLKSTLHVQDFGIEQNLLIMQSLQIGTYEYNVQTNIVISSENLDKVYGFHDDVLKRPFEEFFARVHPEDVKGVQDKLARSIQDGSTLEHEHRILLPSGEVHWLMTRGIPTFDQSGKVLTLRGIALDITAQKKSAEMIKHSEERLRLAAESTGVGLWELDLKTGQAWRNESHDKVFGHDKLLPEWSFEVFLSYVHPDDREWVKQSMVTAMETNSSFKIQCRIIWQDGSLHWMEAGGKVARLDDGSFSQKMVGTNLEITDKIQAQKNLEASLRTRDEFLSIASHELKTPLTSLKLISQLQRRAAEKNDPKAFDPQVLNDFFLQTEKQVNRLNRLVDDMLDVSRIRSGKLKIELETFDLCSLIAEVLDRFSGQFKEAGYELPETALCETAVGKWDRLRLDQVLSNLLTNAIRYGNKKPIRVSTKSDDSMVRLIVEDQGIGISPWDQKIIFDRFERAVDYSEESGLGLGLFITQQIVIAHYGKIWVESEPTKGSRFIVELPKIPSLPNIPAD
jgi:PAS domain S-box-containing protein